MVANFDIEGAKTNSEVYRAAKLALLRVHAHQTIERTDASARMVEEHLARFAKDIAAREGETDFATEQLTATSNGLDR